MSGQWTAPVWLVLAAGLLVLLLAALALWSLGAARRERRHTADLTAQTTSLARRLDDLEQRMAAPETDLEAATPTAGAGPSPYVITQLGDAPDPVREPAPTLPPGAFADVVLREGALRTASLLYGLRRALAPETRDRIRGEMRREVKRQRKDRRAEVRATMRARQARQRSETAA